MAFFEEKTGFSYLKQRKENKEKKQKKTKRV